MGRKRIKFRDSSPLTRQWMGGMGEAEPAEQPGDAKRRTNGFTLRLSHGHGILRMENISISEIITIDRLELAIPKISFPFDITGGVEGLNNKRHVLARLSLTVSLEGLLKTIQRRLLGSTWIADPMISFEREHVTVLLKYGPAETRIAVSFRLVPLMQDNVPHLLIDEPRCYGPLPANLLAIASACVEEMLGVRPKNCAFIPPNPVKAALLSVLPKRGWRLPDYDGVDLVDLKLLPDRATLDFRHLDYAIIWSDEGVKEDEAPQLDQLRRIEEQRFVKEGDALLLMGNTAQARSIYATLLTQEPDNALIVARLAMIDITHPDVREAALMLVAETLEQAPTRTDIAAVAAQGAALAHDAAAEAEALSRLVEHGDSLERLASGLRRGRILLAAEPEQAIAALKDALRHRRENREALDALLWAHAVQGNTQEINRLAPRWIAVHKSAKSRASAHLRVGHLLLDQGKDPHSAIHHFERAALSDPDNMEAVWGLGESLAKAGKVKRALGHFERMERRCNEAQDSHGAARALGSIGDIWLNRGEISLAIARFRQALKLQPEASRLRARLGFALLELRQEADAAHEFEQALNRAGLDCRDEWWARTALELSRLCLILDDLKSAELWIQASLARPISELDARPLLIELLERQERFDALTAELAREYDRQPTAENAIRLINAQRSNDNAVGAFSTAEQGKQRFPDNVALLDLLIETSREINETSRLRSALIERVQSCTSKRRRVDMGIEIGQLELTAFADPQSAADWFNQVLEEDPVAIDARQGMVEVHRQLGDDQALDEELAHTIDLCRESGELERASALTAERARTVLRTGDTAKAAAIMKEAIAHFPPDDKFQEFCEVAVLFRRAGELDTARQLLTAARQVMANEDACQTALQEAEIAIEMEDFKGALEAAIEAGSGPNELRARAAMLAARSYVALERHQEAADTLERVSGNLEPEDAIPLQLFATRVCADFLSDHPRAIALLEDILAMEPQNPEARGEMSRLLDASGDRPALAEWLLRTPVEEEERALANFERAHELFVEAGLRDRALQTAQRLYKLKRSLKYALLLSQAFKEVGDSAGMTTLLEEWIDEAPEARELLLAELEDMASRDDPQGEIAIQAAKLAETAGDPNRAKKLWRMAVTRNPQPSSVAQLVARLDPQTEGDELTEWLDQVHDQQLQADLVDRLILIEARAELELVKGNELRAAKHLALLSSLIPQDTRPWNRAAEILKRRGEWKVLAERMTLRLDLVENWAERATLAVELGEIFENKLADENQAFKAYELALEARPDNERARMALATLAYRKHKWKQLDALLEELPQKDDTVELRIWRAEAAEALGQTDRALELYRNMTTTYDPSIRAVEGLSRLAQAAQFDEEVAQAAERLIEVVGAEKVKVAVHRRVGLARLRLGNTQAALDHLQTADRISDGDPEVLHFLAATYARAGQHTKQSEILARLAYKTTDVDQRAEILVTLGQLHLVYFDDPNRARHWFNRAADEAPDKPDVLIGAADCAWAMNDFTTVARNLERLKTVAPERQLSAVHVYRLSAALAKTHMWPDSDILELIEPSLPSLADSILDEAIELVHELKERRKP